MDAPTSSHAHGECPAVASVLSFTREATDVSSCDGNGNADSALIIH